MPMLRWINADRRDIPAWPETQIAGPTEGAGSMISQLPSVSLNSWLFLQRGTELRVFDALDRRLHDPANVHSVKSSNIVPVSSPQTNAGNLLSGVQLTLAASNLNALSP